MIDGLQRLHAVVSFIDGSFSLPDGRIFDIDLFPTAKTRSDAGLFAPIDAVGKINTREATTILDYSLALSVMRGASNNEVDDVFDRINTYGHRLSDQERRQAGVQNEFSDMIRDLSCVLRGDASAQILPLDKMPSISIDLPVAKHGYLVKAEEVFWVEQGILRSTDLRDSMDEQCVADIAACIVSGDVIERSKDALDEIYMRGEPASERALTALEVYGRDNFTDEFKFCVDELLKVCSAGKDEKLRDLIFKRKTSNAFPSVFAVIIIAMHEIIFKDKKKISSHSDVKEAIRGLSERIETGRKSTSTEERRKNIDAIKGLISKNFVSGDVSSEVYRSHSTSDIEALIRRSEIELSDYELKQGILTLAPKRGVDPAIFEKVCATICAIANNGKGRSGKIIIGVADKQGDSDRIAEIDAIIPKKIGKKNIVGISREASFLNMTNEQYYTKWRDEIKNSKLSQKLKDSVLSNIDYNSFFGLGVIVLSIPPQSELSVYNDQVYWREGDATKLAETPLQIAGIAQRF